MAGSIKWFVYEADDGTEFALRGDESNIEAVNGSTNDYDSSSDAIYVVPGNLKPRYAVYSNTSGIRRVVVALTPDVYSGIEPGDTITDQTTGSTLRLSSKVGESITLPRPADSGLTDGDAT